MPYIFTAKDFRKTWRCSTAGTLADVEFLHGLVLLSPCTPEEPHEGCGWVYVVHRELSERTWGALTSRGGPLEDEGGPE